MASQTRPFLMTGAALASAAAIVAATPAIVPNVTAPAPLALSAAQVELTTFSDLLSITPAEWNDYLFIGWGGAIGPINVDPDLISDYWIPQCNYDCTIGGPSGLLYLALDALINGNGQGINDASNWGVSALNYFFEGSLSTGFQYLFESPFLGEPYKEPGPLYNPQIAELIKLAFQGPDLVTTVYVQALSTIAVLASGLPAIGEYLYRGIGSYIGPAFRNIDSFYDYSVYAGISGVLRYIGGVILTGGNPNPYPLVDNNAAAAAATGGDTAAADMAATAVAEGPAGDGAAAVTDGSASEAAASVAGGQDAAESDTAAAAAAESPAGSDAESADAGSAEAEAAAAVAVAAEDPAGETTPAAVEADAATPADDSGAEAMLSSLPDSVSEAPAAAAAEAPAKSSKRPVRGALERATKRIASAIGGDRSAATAGASASASADADAGSADAGSADAGSAGADSDS